MDFLPTAGQIGVHEVTVEAHDLLGKDAQNYQLVVFPATNTPGPVAEANGPHAALEGELIAFSSAGTFDPGADPLSYAWNFGDGMTSTEANPTHDYAAAGEYIVSLFVNDGRGGTAFDQTRAVITRPNRVPTAVLNGTNFTRRLGESLTLDASDSFDLDGDTLSYAWTLGDGTVTNTGTDPELVHTYTATGSYAGSLVVDDGQGGSDSLFRAIRDRLLTDRPALFTSK